MTLTKINKAGLDELALDHVFTIGASGSSAYTFQGEGLNGTVNNPTLYLTRGKTYRFENGTGAHPIRIQSTSGASGTAYNTGVTNNAGSGTVIVEVQHDAPDVLYYQCTSHAAMNGILYITGALADGGVTTAKIAADAVTTAKIADDAVTSAKLADSSVQNATIATGAVTTTKINDGAATTAKIANDAVTTAKIADQAVTLAKLPHGDSNNDGKFLRANNGADPSFETVNIPAGTTINNNANNRVITGSGTANTLEGESNLTFTGSNLTVTNGSGASELTLVTPDNTDGGVYFNDGSNAGALMYQHSDNSMRFRVNATEKMRIVSNGEVGINLTNPETYGISGTGYGGLTVQAPSGGYSGISIRSSYAGAGGLFFADGNGSNAERKNGFITCDHVNKYLNFGLDGNRIARFSTHGFHPNPADSAAANALDDYEEGTWTPTLTNVYAAGTSSGRVCVYRKIGQMVFITFDIFASASNMDINTSGDTVIGGLPFTTPANFNTTFQVAIYMNNASGQQMANYVNTGPQIVLHGSSRINNVRHLWGFGCYPAS